MDCAATFDTNVVRTLADGRKVSYPRIDATGIETIAGELLQKKSESNERLAGKHRISNWEKFRVDQELERVGVPLGEILAYVRTPEGYRRVLDMSRKVAGHSDAEHAQNTKVLGPLGMFDLASELLSMPTPPPVDGTPGGPPRPNDQTPQSQPT